MRINRKKFEQSIIAWDDDRDYSESGYAICVFPDTNKAAIFHYSHCSCYGTWEALNGQQYDDYYYGDEEPEDREIHESWTGTVDQLIHMAKNSLDFSIEGRKVNEEDYDADHLLNCYKQVLSYFKIATEGT